eukprot:3517689-Rhodomonas_salina.4
MRATRARRRRRLVPEHGVTACAVLRREPPSTLRLLLPSTHAHRRRRTRSNSVRGRVSGTPHQLLAPTTPCPRLLSQLALTFRVRITQRAARHRTHARAEPACCAAEQAALTRTRADLEPLRLHQLHQRPPRS